LPRYQAEVALSFERSVRTAIVSRSIARVLRLSHGHAYLWGLLHDIGEARIYRILSRMETALEPGPALEALVFRHHARAGADVARAWNLPSEIVDVCTRHHDDVGNMAPHVRVVRAADEVVRLFDARPGEEWTEADVPTLLMAGATSDQVRLILEDSAKYMAEPVVREPGASKPRN
jgi:putative nucleotidyltransferase with HDIG domain